MTSASQDNPRDTKIYKISGHRAEKDVAYAAIEFSHSCTLINAACASISTNHCIDLPLSIELIFHGSILSSSAAHILIGRNAAIRRMPPSWISTVHHQTRNNQLNPACLRSTGYPHSHECPQSFSWLQHSGTLQRFKAAEEEEEEEEEKDETNHNRSLRHDLNKQLQRSLWRSAGFRKRSIQRAPTLHVSVSSLFQVQRE